MLPDKVAEECRRRGCRIVERDGEGFWRANENSDEMRGGLAWGGVGVLPQDLQFEVLPFIFSISSAARQTLEFQTVEILIPLSLPFSCSLSVSLALDFFVFSPLQLRRLHYSSSGWKKIGKEKRRKGTFSSKYSEKERQTSLRRVSDDISGEFPVKYSR
ncbi:hypothetical protein L1049_019417 [Liquidambar formosana]|uniref:Uncharacterized protein n=1 Tax=Liquidambar formosana TaxID=63359 RepID=A0AAP0SCK2_LIQFO